MRILIPSLKPESQYIVRIAPSRNIQQKTHESRMSANA